MGMAATMVRIQRMGRDTIQTRRQIGRILKQAMSRRVSMIDVS